MNTFENPANQNNKSNLIRIAEEIEATLIKGEKEEEQKKQYYNLFKKYFEANGAVEYSEWQKELQRLAKNNPKMIVRREVPEKVLAALDEKKNLPIHISDDYGKQPNAAVLGDDCYGLNLALTGGFGKIGKGSVAITLGFEPSEKIKVEDLPDNQFNNFQGKERRSIKIVEGDVPFEDIKFVLMRMPYKFFPEDEMTDFELEKNPAYIQRMYRMQNMDNKKGSVSLN